MPGWSTHWKEIASDGSGGVIIIQHSESTTWAQRVDSQGNILWQAGGVQVPGESACIASDGSGGCMIAYRHYPDGNVGYIFAQRIDAEGNVLRGPDGITSTTRDIKESGLTLVSDGRGGLLIS